MTPTIEVLGTDITNVVADLKDTLYNKIALDHKSPAYLAANQIGSK